MFCHRIGKCNTFTKGTLAVSITIEKIHSRKLFFFMIRQPYIGAQFLTHTGTPTRSGPF